MCLGLLFDGGLGTQFVVHKDGTDRTGLRLAADHCSRNIVLLQIGQHIDIHEHSIRNYDQRFHPAVEQHFQIALEAAALAVYVV
jgi:hypothetical protein